MKAIIVSDKEYQTDTYRKLEGMVKEFLHKRGYTIEEIQIGREDLAYCMGCFGCWIKTPGECVIKDKMAHINHAYINCDVAIYLSPIVFGQFSANIKNSLDRWIPNILPFFKRRPDGSSMHPSRYKHYPKQIIIGFSDEVSSEDAQLFIDITQKHRRNVDTFVYQKDDKDITMLLEKIELKKVGVVL